MKRAKVRALKVPELLRKGFKEEDKMNKRGKREWRIRVNPERPVPCTFRGVK